MLDEEAQQTPSMHLTWDPRVMNYSIKGHSPPSALLCTVITLLPLRVETDIWLIRCETLPPLQMQWQTPALWLIKNQTDLFSFSSGEQGGSVQEDISINVTLNLLPHWRVFGGLTFLISQLFSYKFKHLHTCVEVSTSSKAHITFCTLPLKSKCSVSVLTTVCCRTVSMQLPRGQHGETISAWQKQVFTSFYP